MSPAFLDLAPDGIVVVDPSGHILLVNQQIELLFGYQRAALIGGPVETLVPTRLHARHTRHRKAYIGAPHTRPMGSGLALFGRRRDGTEFPVEVSLSPLPVADGNLVMAIIRDVTERTRAEQERREQAERLALQATLINTAHDAILVRDAASRITAWNQGAAELYGWTEEAAVGQVSHTLLQTRFPHGLATVDATLLSAGRWEGELEHTRADGQVLLMESRQVMLRDRAGKPTAILEINRDVTERKRLEALEHAASQQRLMLLQTVLEELPGGAYLVQGSEARLVLANHAARDIWGASWGEGVPMEEFLRSSGVQYCTESGVALPLEDLPMLQVARGGPAMRQLREAVQRPDCTRVPILHSVVTIEAALWSGQPGAVAQRNPKRERAVLGLLQDISEMEGLEQLKDEFITVAAHELRTPLTAIQGFSNMLAVQTRLGRGTELADWQHEAIDEIEEASRRMNKIVTDLLDATRIQAGRMELKPTPLDLMAAVRRAMARFQLSAAQHALLLEVSDAPDAPVMVLADSARLEQVLGNLLGNAIKYSPAGGPVTIRIRVDQPAAQAELRVQDTGIGIPADQQPLLFRRFVRARNVHDHGITGSGLGLYVCRELVERQGGKIWFESAEGVGTTFFVTLPLATSQEHGTERA